MQRGERAGFGLSLVGHVGLLAIMSLNLMSERPKPPPPDTMDVMLTDKAGLVSAAPTQATEAPQAAQAPEIGPVEDASPPPEPTPAPPKAEAKPVPPPKPAAVAIPKPAPPAPKAAPAKPAPPKPEKGKPKATALGDDFLKGIPATKSQGKGEVARAATLSPIQANGLSALIASQVKPCYTIPAGGADTAMINSRVHIRMKPDGSIAVAPEVVGNTGVTPTNQPYLRQMNEAATRAVQRCAPLKLPPELYDVGGQGWKDITFTFRPSQMG
jgi:outer membrane biosynthesis protein TonB